MKAQFICTALAFLAMNLGTAASASTIVWTQQGDFSNNIVLSLAGPTSSELYGIGFLSSPLTTANGYSFANSNYSSNLDDSYNGFLTDEGGTTSDTAFDSILTNAIYTFTPPLTLTLENLTVGMSYNVLMLAVDTRAGNDGAYFSPNGTDTQVYGFTSGGVAVGGYFLGTFTADSSTQDITSSVTNPNSDPVTTGGQINAVLVTTAVPEPGTCAMLLGGLAVLMMARFRHKLRSATSCR